MAKHKHDFERDGLCIICDADFWRVAHEELARLRSALETAVNVIDVMMYSPHPLDDQWFSERDRLILIVREALDTPDRTVFDS